jgi:hypothetical protein
MAFGHEQLHVYRGGIEDVDSVREEPGDYRVNQFDTDTDTDTDTDLAG